MGLARQALELADAGHCQVVALAPAQAGRDFVLQVLDQSAASPHNRIGSPLGSSIHSDMCPAVWPGDSIARTPGARSYSPCASRQR